MEPFVLPMVDADVDTLPCDAVAQLRLESGGRLRKCRVAHSVFGTPNGRVVNVSKGKFKLPNPKHAIDAQLLDDTAGAIEAWICLHAADEWNQVMNWCESQLRRGVHVRVQCHGGQHRSYAVVEALASRLEDVHLLVVHCDRVKRA